MQLEHSFVIPVGVEQAWKILLDIERIAPCMPGAAIDSVDGDDFTGSVKVKLGPINITYKGKASFIEKDEKAHRAVIDARGKDARGAGTASAKITATLLADGETTTKVDVLTVLDITGKPAQFGRGVMVDVGNKLLGQFADCLAGKLSESDEPTAQPDSEPAAATAEDSADAEPKSAPADDVAPAEAAAPAQSNSAGPLLNGASGTTAAADRGTRLENRPSAARHAAPTHQEVEPINLIESAGPAVAKRLAPVVGVLLLVLLVVVLRRRSR